MFVLLFDLFFMFWYNINVSNKGGTMAKKKKEPKIEKVFGNNDDLINDNKNSESSKEQVKSDIEEFLGVEESPEDKLSEKQKKKLEKINSVKSKISKILKTSNIEIVDENFDDDYDYGGAETADGQSQQDYDSLKALYSGKDKNKKQEVTLTIDDFDYMYIGQYLEEYDLMHMKNIKKVRIQKKRSPKLKKFFIISSLVLIVSLGVVLGFFLTRETPVYLKSVSLNKNSRDYYVEQEFDFRGLYFIAEYSDGSIEKISLNSSYFNSEQSTGRIEKTGDNNEDIVFVSNGTANLVFTYKGFNVDYVVSVSKKIDSGFHASYTEGLFNLSEGEYITKDFLTLYVTYQNIGNEPVDFSKSFVVKVDGEICEYSSQAQGYQVSKKTGTTKDSVITISYSNYEDLVLLYENCYV